MCENPWEYGYLGSAHWIDDELDVNLDQLIPHSLPRAFIMNENPERDAEFVALLTEHQSSLRYYVASLLPGESASADVVQAANATIWKKRDQFQIGTNFKAWIFAISRYEVLNFRKKQVRDRRFVFNDELIDVFAAEMPQLTDDLDDRVVTLRTCIAKLRPVEQELIRHRYFEQTPLQEVAEIVDRSVGGLKVTLHRVRTKLQRCIEINLKQA